MRFAPLLFAALMVLLGRKANRIAALFAWTDSGGIIRGELIVGRFDSAPAPLRD
ncbi:hypothetical protein [Erythrobacter sp. 3-20A1M]|uniref:hypothetical protein n=1 Tax=Erythrobacter sp. 3-20A1M TaxID=2653850 RepID=UPI001BFCB512|nr:hypothetical protein [Erythrobacter sp. 3-20A1M]